MLQKPETISCANPYLQAGQDQNEFYYPAVELLPHHCTGKTKATGKTCVLQTFFSPHKVKFFMVIQFSQECEADSLNCKN